jgi:putative spermidine/putrescine transport system permease protein
MTEAVLSLPSPGPAIDRERLTAFGFALPSFLIIAGIFALPLALLLGVSVIGPDGLTFANYSRLLGTPYYLGVIWNSLRLGLLTTLIALAVSYPAAFALARPRRRPLIAAGDAVSAARRQRHRQGVCLDDHPAQRWDR